MMSSHERRFLWVIVASMLFGAGVSSALGPFARAAAAADEIAPAFLSSRIPLPQEQHTRIFRSLEWNQQLRIGAENGVFAPGQIKAGRSSTMFVVDTGDGRIKHFDIRGHLIDTRSALGSGKPTDVIVGDDRVWICTSSGDVTVATDSGEQADVPWASAQKPIRGALVGKSLMFHSVFTPASFISAFDMAGRPLGHVVAPIDQGDKGGPAVFGSLASDGESVFYAAQYGGFITKARPDGTEDFLVSTIDGGDPPHVRVMPSGALKQVRNGRGVTIRAVTAHGSLLTVLVHAFEGLSRVSYADVYEKSNGRYRYSLRLPEVLNSVDVDGDTVYGSVDHEVVVWKSTAS